MMGSREDELQALALKLSLLQKQTIPGELEQLAMVSTMRSALDSVPTEYLSRMLTDALKHNPSHPPRINDLLAAWQRYQISLPRKTFWEEERERLPALPSTSSLGNDGPGRRAFIVNRDWCQKFGHPVRCRCVDVNGQLVTAKLQADSLEFGCSQGQCDFRLTIDEMIDVIKR